MKVKQRPSCPFIIVILGFVGAICACGGGSDGGEESGGTALFVPETEEGSALSPSSAFSSSSGTAQESGSGSSQTSQPPVIVSQPETTAVVNEPYQYTVQAEGTPPITYALTIAPDGMTIDETSGDITWVPKIRDTLQNVAVEVEARNDYGSDTQIWTINVTR